MTMVSDTTSRPRVRERAQPEGRARNIIGQRSMVVLRGHAVATRAPAIQLSSGRASHDDDHEGVYRYVPNHLVPDYLDQGWVLCAPVGVWSMLMKAPIDG